jgi:hypothetical protein
LASVDSEYWLGLFESDATYHNALFPNLTVPKDFLAAFADAVPDWRIRIVAMYGDESGAAFEWLGEGQFRGVLGVQLHGCTVISRSPSGRITNWVDYIDVKEWDRCFQLN